MASQDFEEFIAALNAHGVRYLIVGAHAVAFHARPRATKDLDILLDATSDNAQRALNALRAFFGGADLGYTAEDLTDPRFVIQLGVAPVRIDLLFELEEHLDFGSLWNNRVQASFGSVEAHYIGLEDLISAKEASGRLQDRVDVRVLRRAKERTTPEGPRRGDRKRPPK